MWETHCAKSSMQVVWLFVRSLFQTPSFSKHMRVRNANRVYRDAVLGSLASIDPTAHSSIYSSIHPSYFWSCFLFQRLEDLCVDLVHVESLESWERSFHSKKRNNWFVNSQDGNDKIASSRLQNEDQHKNNNESNDEERKPRS